MDNAPLKTPSKSDEKRQLPTCRPAARFASGRIAGCLVCLVSLLATTAHAQRNLRDIPPPDPELERKTFQVADGFEVNLYAADPLLAKPIQMNFDAQGRLWVASSEVYPQIKPGQTANDKILVLEDTDRDGQADKTTVFADGLLIPTGVEPGHGGAYVAASTQLLHLRDTDGDGRADQRRVVLSGFGTEDTHHLLHTLRWGHDGALYMNQSIYIHSHLETPYGVRRMNGGGVWRFKPDTMQLETYNLGLVNSWGHHFNRDGVSFQTDGAGGDGINYTFPGFVGVTSPGAQRVLRGLNPGSPKHCGLELVDGTHLPESWRGNAVTNDFRAHRVCRFVLREDGSGYASQEQEELIKSTHVAFRPIDVKMGPDGAIYIADWYNPIIQHGEVDFRDERRDHTHGRIWRITAKDRPLVEPPELAEAKVEQLLDHLTSPDPWTRHNARRVLDERGPDEVLAPLDAWVAAIEDASPAADRQRLAALWTYQALDTPRPELLQVLLESPTSGVRGAATRVLGYWIDQVENPLPLLAARAADSHARVRLEAARALARSRHPRACELAMRALDQPMDKFLEFALWKTARDLKTIWLPALESGEIDFDGNATHLAFALKAVEAPGVVPLLIAQLRTAELSTDQVDGLLGTIAALANPQQLRDLFNEALAADREPGRRIAVLAALQSAATRRKLRPAGSTEVLASLFEADDIRVQAAALRLAGAWKMEQQRARLAATLQADNADDELKDAARHALVSLGGAASRRALANQAEQAQSTADRVAAAIALADLDVQQAAGHAARLLVSFDNQQNPRPLVRALLSRQAGAAALTAALADRTIQADIARLALREVSVAGRPEPELAEALKSAGQLAAGHRSYTDEQLQELLTAAAERGDLVRGEAVFRSQRMACFKCHAIGGAGGQVGPDLSSIGASAQPDYLVESLIEPSKKIKENYHSLVVMTDEGRVATGVKIRETDSELILRDAEDRELRIALDSIEGQKDGGSLMPVGLTDSLTDAEMTDLVAFLSSLGKVGKLAVPKQPLVRRWQALLPTKENEFLLRRGAFTLVAGDDPRLVWDAAYSRVDGSLPVAELPALNVKWATAPMSFIRFQVEVTTPGKATFRLPEIAGVSMWIDGRPIELGSTTETELAGGTRTVLLAVDREQAPAQLTVELPTEPSSKIRAQIVHGK